MRKYVHWIEVNGMVSSKDEAEQINQLLEYKKEYPNTEFEVYTFNRGSFNSLIRLECEQSYNDLDMIVNSGSSELRRKGRKPKNITKWVEFKDFILNRDYIHEYLIPDYKQIITQ